MEYRTHKMTKTDRRRSKYQSYVAIKEKPRRKRHEKDGLADSLPINLPLQQQDAPDYASKATVSQSDLSSPEEVKRPNYFELAKSYVNSGINVLKLHASDVTAGLIIGAPLGATLETSRIVGMNLHDSINSRILGISLSIAGSATLYSGGRDYIKKKLGITKDSSRIIRWGTDTLYSIGYAMPYCPVFYYANKCFYDGILHPLNVHLASLTKGDAYQIFMATDMGCLSSAAMGITAGFMIDGFRDLTGLKESPTLPRVVKKQTPLVKKVIAAGLMAASFFATMNIYSTPKNHEQNPQPRGVQTQRFEENNPQVHTRTNFSKNNTLENKVD